MLEDFENKDIVIPNNLNDRECLSVKFVKSYDLNIKPLVWKYSNNKKGSANSFRKFNNSLGQNLHAKLFKNNLINNLLFELYDDGTKEELNLFGQSVIKIIRKKIAESTKVPVKLAQRKSSYKLFSEVCSNHGINHANVVLRLWRNMSREEREVYTNKAIKNMDDYKVECQNFLNWVDFIIKYPKDFIKICVCKYCVYKKHYDSYYLFDI